MAEDTRALCDAHHIIMHISAILMFFFHKSDWLNHFAGLFLRKQAVWIESAFTS